MLIKKMYLPCFMKVFTFMVLSGFFSAYASPLDFKTCVQTALSQSPETEASLARLTQAESALSKVKSSRLPQITLSVTGSQSDSAQNVFGMKLQQRQATIGDLVWQKPGRFFLVDPRMRITSPTALINLKHIRISIHELNYGYPFGTVESLHTMKIRLRL